ncbi:MAG: DUF952 domain-containing protein [Hyphomicrobium aestuarii]|nr:DUF952 domain-containing protein [Hyphomicrobium aestuarii]
MTQSHVTPGTSASNTISPRTPSSDILVYKITGAEAWQSAIRTGVLEASSVDVRDGFVHLSASHQVAETARRYFAGQPGLMLVAWRSSDLAPGLKWEASRGGDVFPHQYGALPIERALWAEPLPLGPDDAPDVDGAIARAASRHPGSAGAEAATTSQPTSKPSTGTAA